MIGNYGGLHRLGSTSWLAVPVGMCRSLVNYLLWLTFLSPAIVEAIVAGQQPVEPRAQTLIKRVALPSRAGPVRSEC
jgi:hypothetical protein